MQVYSKLQVNLCGYSVPRLTLVSNIFVDYAPETFLITIFLRDLIITLYEISNFKPLPRPRPPAGMLRINKVNILEEAY